jgi:beta-N-acetylhexosaminidase
METHLSRHILPQETRFLRMALVALLLCLYTAPAGAAVPCAAATQPAAPQADPVAVLMSEMTTREKVGQLFLVAFWGRNPSPPSRAGQLIQQYKVGGVVLLAQNNNLVNGLPTTTDDVLRLTNLLQGMALDVDGSTGAGTGIPLLIGVEHEGDGFPHTQITNGLTPLPSPMAIGATWDTGLAEQAGEVIGHELAALGINLLLGPSADVLSDPRPGSRGDLGTRAFGGDPYWVGEMARATIHGVHVGSQGKVLTVTRHFPGQGSSDRLPGDEVATVDKSLQELARVELAPFFAVTEPRDPQGLDRTDALLTTHIRYRGFRGDIRQFTRPISFDGEALGAILDLPPLRQWRKTGVLVSDSLGVPAVRKYFDPQLQTFPHRQIAREALLAGNDLLLLSHFALVADWPQEFENTIEVIEYFNETYERDPAFAARVDEAAARILRLKLNLYPDLASGRAPTGLAPAQVLVAPPEQGADSEQAAAPNPGAATANEIARRAATVLLPTESSLPRPPRRDEDILILVEDRRVKQCSDPIPECDPRPLLPPQAVEETLLRLYGPQGTGLVDPERVHTRTYAQLKRTLTSAGDQEGEMSARTEFVRLLGEADWIVFAMLDPDPQYLDSDALQLFLAQNAHQIYDARVVVLAYTAPYYLDATEISKLTAYYVLYSKVQPAIEASVRTLFGELRPQGRSPVSIEGTNYDLNAQLSPDPGQQIALELIEPAVPAGDAPLAVRVRTAPIFDRNGNPVPDGTLVRFAIRDATSGQTHDTATGPTTSGIAEAELTLDQAGQILLVASSGDTGEGPPLALTVRARPTPTSPPPTQTKAVRPTTTPTLTPSSTPTPTTQPTTQPTITLAPTPTTISRSPTLAAALDAWAGQPSDLLGVLGGILLGALGGLGLFRRRLRRQGQEERRAGIVRLLLAAWLGGALAYLAYGFLGAGVRRWVNGPAWSSAGLVGLVGAMVLVAVFALNLTKRSPK